MIDSTYLAQYTKDFHLPAAHSLARAGIRATRDSQPGWTGVSSDFSSAIFFQLTGYNGVLRRSIDLQLRFHLLQRPCQCRRVFMNNGTGDNVWSWLEVSRRRIGCRFLFSAQHRIGFLVQGVSNCRDAFFRRCSGTCLFIPESVAKVFGDRPDIYFDSLARLMPSTECKYFFPQ